VLTLEIYKIVIKTDISFVISFILKIITKQLELLTISTIVCTNSFLLYKCLVKLSTTKEKRLIINIIAIRQLYKQQKLFKIRWINRLNNPANVITKATLNKALENFVTTNKIRVQVKG
jgi:hypothetical protein